MEVFKSWRFSTIRNYLLKNFRRAREINRIKEMSELWEVKL